MKHTKLSAALALSGVSVLLLAGCGSNGASSATPGGDIVFRSYDAPAEVVGLKKAVDQWNSDHAVKVKFETVASADALAQYTRETNGKAGPDVAQTALTWVRDLAKNGLVENLDPYIKKDAPGAGINDFLALDINKLNGSVYGVPWTVDTFALAYDPAVLRQAGVTAMPTTWDEFAKVAKKLTTPNRAGFCFAASSAPTSDLFHLFNYYLWGQGASLVESSDGKSKIGASNAQIAQTFSYLNDFFTSGTTPASMLSVDTAGDPAINAAIADGRCAIAFMPPSPFRTALAVNSKLLTAPLPAGTTGKPTTHLGGRALTVNPNSKNKDAAWSFIKFLTSKKIFQDYYTTQFPAQKSLLKEIDYGPELAGYQKSLPSARSYSMYVNSPSPTSAYWNEITQTLGTVFSHQATPDGAVPAFVTSVKGLVNK